MEYADYVSRDEVRRHALQAACPHPALRVVATCRACGKGTTVEAADLAAIPTLLSVTILCCRLPADPPAPEPAPAESSA